MSKKRPKKGGNSKKVTGIIKITAKPMGFVVSDTPQVQAAEDIVVYEEGLNCALDKDRVEVHITGRDRNRKRGRVTKILERFKTRFVGTIEKAGAKVFFRPDDIKFYREVELLEIPPNVSPGTKALVELLPWNNPELNPRGKIITFIGAKGEHETEMRSILLDKGIIYDFPKDVEREAEEIARDWQTASTPSMLRISRSDSSPIARRDFRNILTFTIDPVDAKDFDDALSFEDLGNGKLRVGVHIADVSHFVKPGGALDKEARKRAFSVYLVDRTIPMLPEALSNDICSLKPGVDRFAFSAVFDLEQKSGRIIDRWFGKTIINSDRRFSYEEAQTVLESGFKSIEPSKGDSLHIEADFSLPLREIDRLAKIYREQNKKNGAIEFETDEVRFELDDKGRPLKIFKKPRLDSMKMIEEWMLLANREVAKFISDKIEKRGGASIFRIHDLPNMEKLEELAVFVRALGHDLPIRGGSVRAKDLNILLAQIEGHASESLIKTAAVRSMAKAVYSTKNIGHFGLAFDYYTHFTSPIRRYPDLMVHRILEKHLKGESLSKNEFARFEKIAQEASEKEIVVAEAERESIKYKQVEFMQDKIGAEFEAVISGVTEWGMYVEIPETKAEGMVRLRNMEDDYYKLDQKNYAIVGERTKKKYSLGDNVRVRLAGADLERKNLDFALI